MNKLTETEVVILMHLVNATIHMQQVVATDNTMIDALRVLYKKLDDLDCC